MSSENVINSEPVTPPSDGMGNSAPLLPISIAMKAKRHAAPMPGWIKYAVMAIVIVGVALLVYSLLVMQKEGVNSAIKRDNDGSQIGIVSTTIPGVQIGYRDYWDAK